MLEFLLILNSLFLFLIYKRLGGQIRPFSDDYEAKMTTNDWLKRLVENTNYYFKKLIPVADYFQSTNPAGFKSSSFKKKDELIKIYADYLSKKNRLSKRDSLIRSRFELYNVYYDEDKIIGEINDDAFGYLNSEEAKKSTLDYYNSGLLDKDIEEVWNPGKGVKKLIPHDIFEPLFYLLSDRSDWEAIKKGDFVSFALGFGHEDNYNDFVKNRAIIKALISYKILEKVDNKGWHQYPKFKINIVDKSKLREVVYEGASSHDDSYFQKRVNEGEVNSFLSKSF